MRNQYQRQLTCNMTIDIKLLRTLEMTPGTVKAKLHNNRYDKKLCDNEQTILLYLKHDEV